MQNELEQFVEQVVLPHYFEATDKITNIVEIEIDSPGDEYIVTFKVNSSFYAVYSTDYLGIDNVDGMRGIFEHFGLEVKRLIQLKNTKDKYIFSPYNEDHPFRPYLLHCSYVVAELAKDPNIEDELIKDSLTEVNLIALSDISTYPTQWMFSDGGDAFYAPIKDEQFVANADYTKETYLKDDFFRVKLREKQWQTDKGIKTKYEIEEVIEHRSAKQIKLPLEDK